MSELKGAIIGYGLAGSTFHAPLISSTPGLAVATVVTSDPGRRDQALRDQPEVRVVPTPEELWRLADEHDFVVIAVPHSDATTGLVNPDVLAGMRPSAYLINVGRGPVVDQWALYDAPVNGRLAGAAIDVWYHYPEGADPVLPSDAPLHTLPNVILTPHTAGYTEGTMRHRYTAIAENIRRLVAGEPLENVVWPRA